MKGIGKIYEKYKKVVKHEKAVGAAGCTLSEDSSAGSPVQFCGSPLYLPLVVKQN